MTDKPTQQGYLSKCHDAPVLIFGGAGDFLDGAGIHTCSFECAVCHEPCDIYPNPVEHIPKQATRPLAPPSRAGTFRMLDDPVTPHMAERRARKDTERSLDAANEALVALAEKLGDTRNRLRETTDLYVALREATDRIEAEARARGYDSILSLIPRTP